MYSNLETNSTVVMLLGSTVAMKPSSSGLGWLIAEGWEQHCASQATQSKGFNFGGWPWNSPSQQHAG